MTSIIASIWTSLSTLVHSLDVHLFCLFVQACSSDCKFLKASECMCVCDFFHFIGFAHSVCSTPVAMVKIQPWNYPAARSAPEEGSFPLPRLAPHWCRDSRSFSGDLWIAQFAVYPLFFPEEYVFFTICIPCLITEVEQCLTLSGVPSSLPPLVIFPRQHVDRALSRRGRRWGLGKEIGRTFCLIS